MSENISGFKGAVAGLSLMDVIQLKGHNKYTGAITVEYDDSKGAIHFVDGEIIHAEQGGEVGESAIYQINKWPGGTFNFHPEISSSVRTVHYRTDVELKEALQRMDAENSRKVKSVDGPSAAAPRTMSKIAARLQELNNINYAVLLEKDGTPVQDTSFEAVALSSKGMFLAMTGNQLGELLGLGEIKSVALQTSNFHLLMYDSKQHYLSIAVKPGCKLEKVESEIKFVLVPGK